jgi:hypothetical protein
VRVSLGGTQGEEILFGLLGSAAVIGLTILATHGPWTLPTCSAYDPQNGRCVTNQPCGFGLYYDVCGHGCVSDTRPVPAPLPCPSPCLSGQWCDPCAGVCRAIPVCGAGYAFSPTSELCALAV